MIACLERITGGYDLYIGVIVMTLSVFIFAINNPDFAYDGVIEYIGTKLYLYFYLVHPFAIHAVVALADNMGWTQMSWFGWIRPLLVILITFMMSEFVYKGFSYLNEKKIHGE